MKIMKTHIKLVLQLHSETSLHVYHLPSVWFVCLFFPCSASINQKNLWLNEFLGKQEEKNPKQSGNNVSSVLVIRTTCSWQDQNHVFFIV